MVISFCDTLYVLCIRELREHRSHCSERERERVRDCVYLYVRDTKRDFLLVKWPVTTTSTGWAKSSFLSRKACWAHSACALHNRHVKNGCLVHVRGCEICGKGRVQGNLLFVFYIWGVYLDKGVVIISFYHFAERISLTFRELFTVTVYTRYSFIY